MLPLGLTIAVLFFGLKFKKRFAFILALAILWTSSIGIISKITWTFLEHPWTRITTNDVPLSDAIVVLSGGMSAPLGAANIIEWNDPDRFFAGVNLYENDRAPKLIFTGGYIPSADKTLTEAKVYKEKAVSLGLPSSSIIMTKLVMNTAQEAVEVAGIMKRISENKTSKIILVTSAYHMKRAKKLFERQGLRVSPFPVDFRSSSISLSSSLRDPLNWVPNSGHLDSNSVGLREILGRLFYRLF